VRRSSRAAEGGKNTTESTTRAIKKTRKAYNPPLNPPRTRSRAKIFRFFDLPPEIRNQVYEFLFAAPSHMAVAISCLRLPLFLQVPRMLSEALPFFFSHTPVLVFFRTAWDHTGLPMA
jgi:hypothetical protein